MTVISPHFPPKVKGLLKRRLSDLLVSVTGICESLVWV